MARRALVTGFEPFDGFAVNPSGRLARALDGERFGDLVVAGRVLPVAYEGLAQHVRLLLDEVEPELVIALGQATGEAVIRLERFAVNLNDFAIPDNAGARLVEAPIAVPGPAARAATLPLAAIEARLLAAGIPARRSNTAGTYLCNATFFLLLAGLEARGSAAPCGFIHVPLLPEQAARRLGQSSEGAAIASMDYLMMARAVRLAIACCTGASS